MSTLLFPTVAFLTPTNSIFVFGLLILLFGAKKLPELARGMGQAIREFTKAKNDIQDEIMREPVPQPNKQIDADVAKAEQPAGTQARTETHV